MSFSTPSINHLKSFAIASAVSLTALTSSLAQNNGAAITDNNKATNANEVLPSLQSSADLALPDGRNITIHREAKVGAERSQAVYFHRPLFAFIENKQGNTDHPIIWDKIEDDGHIYIGLKLALSNAKFRELARGAVIQEDPSIHVEKPGIKERDIVVKPWPLKVLHLEAKHSLLNRSYGTTIPESLNTVGDNLEVSMKVPAEQYDAFLMALKNKRLKFSPSYTFSNIIVAFGQSATHISSQVSTAVDNALASRQLKEGDAISQEDARELRMSLNQVVSTTIRGTDSKVLAHIKPQDLSKHILKSQVVTFADLDGKQNLLKTVEGYLAPIIRQMQKDNTDTKENNEKTTNTDTQNVKIGVGSKGLSGGVDLTNKQVKTLQKKHEVVFKETEDKNVIEAHSININYVRKGWQNNMLSAFKTVYLATGRDNSFQTDFAVRSNFTNDVLEKALGKNEIVVSPYNYIPKGIPMMSFRADVPKGWVVLNGKTNWPKENWVPQHLQGKPVPDMRGAFVRGATGNEQVGILQNKSTLTVPACKITGNSFTATSIGTAGTLNQVGPLIIANANLGYKKHKGKIIMGAGTQWKTHLAIQKDKWRFGEILPQMYSNRNKMFNGAITGTHTIPEQKHDLKKPENQPPHVPGQWIMRIE